MEKYSIELTRYELVRVIEGLGLLIDEAHEEQDKEKFHNASVLRRQLLEVADGELAEFGGHPELVPTGEEPDEKPDRLERYFKGMLGEIPERLRGHSELVPTVEEPEIASDHEDSDDPDDYFDPDAHDHDYTPWGVCTICGYIKYMSPAYCELHGCDPF